MFSPTADGAAAEEAAARHLARQGVRIVARNFRVKGGEIDLIGEHRGVILFIEVRQRRSATFGGAAASITAAKRRRLILAARHWLQRHGERPCRFDAVLLEGDPPRLEWLQAVFSAD